jgi:BirA family biotin operon repressor/biotin-[acetyl-CoA-carboxylase] ligase
VSRLGRPRLHLRETASTNAVARELAAAGAPHGTLVTAGAQTAGRGRQGRAWASPRGALLLSLLIRDPDPLLSLRAGLAVADVAGPDARVKWPNDVLVAGRKVAGVLVEGRPAERWAVLGIGVNAAVEPGDLPPELRASAGTLGLAPERVLPRLLAALEVRLADERPLDALRERDALLGERVVWAGGEGTGAGIASSGGLRVRLADGAETVLDAGEVHLNRAAGRTSPPTRSSPPGRSP